MKISRSLALCGFNSIWQPWAWNKQLFHLNKLHNFLQQTLSNNESTRSSITSSLQFFLLHPPLKLIWPPLPLTVMANLSLIHLHAALTRSPRLWGGSRSLWLSMEKQGDIFITSGGKARGQPPSTRQNRSNQARPGCNRRPPDFLITAVRSLWR